MNRRHASLSIAALTTVMLATLAARAQEPAAGQRGAGGGRGGAPAAPQNLQIFPKDTPRPQVIQTMQAFAAALGVRCGYCSENGLIAVAQRLAADKPDEALRWLELNTEVSPKSSRTYLLMAQIYGRKNDKENQIKSLEKAVELDPQNQQAARMLEQIRK